MSEKPRREDKAVEAIICGVLRGWGKEEWDRVFKSMKEPILEPPQTEKPWDGPIVAKSNGHRWFHFGGFPTLSCRDCGMTRRADDKNSPCCGKVRVELRQL